MRLFSLFAGMVLGCAAALGATFTINPVQSSVTLSGQLSTPFGTVVFQEQGPGSLTSRLEGALEVEATAAEVTIPSGTIDATTNGVWQPAPGGGSGSAPADFGAKGLYALGTIWGALRDILINVNGPARPLQGNQFDASALVFSFPTNSTSKLDYDAGFAGDGSETLSSVATNKAATVGTITGSAGSRTLTIRVDTSFAFSLLSDNDTTLRVEGQIVAREGGGGPGPTGPRFSDIEVVNNQVRLTVDGVTGTARLQSSTNLVTWADKQAEVANVDADTRLFTVPVAGPKEFYQVLQ
jgi:hypothetical protein